jgi:methionyl-tRNA formyltransferase
MGTPAMAVPSLQAVHALGHRIAAVLTQPDRPAGRGRRLTRCPVAETALAMGLPVWQPERVAEAAADLAALGADAACVMAFGQILPPAVLEAFPLGCLNLHTSLLPELRGAAPINWAVIRGHRQSGVTTMFMDPGMDTGDIILQKATPIGPQETAGSLADRLAELGAGLFSETLRRLARGEAPRTPQDESRATYAPRLSKGDGRLDWSRPAEEVDRLVRGLDPWPAAFTTWQGRQLRVFAPTRVLELGPRGAPGQVLEPPEPGYLWVACGRGAVGLGQVQAAGKRRMAAEEFLRGAGPEPGRRLGA